MMGRLDGDVVVVFMHRMRVSVEEEVVVMVVV